MNAALGRATLGLTCYLPMLAFFFFFSSRVIGVPVIKTLTMKNINGTL